MLSHRLRIPVVILVAALAIVPAAAGARAPGVRSPNRGERASRSPSQQSRRPSVRPGIDVLLSDSAHLIAGRRVGLITNRAGVDAAGVPTIDRLARWPAARLVALFAPEHGIRADAPPGAGLGDTLDAATGLPIYSLYGIRRAPTPAQMADLDVLVVDLQDVGARPFTYVSTTILAMRAAARAGKRVVVLDRPNPLGGAVEGPVLEPALASFVGMLAVPLRHGMTLGELARLANAELEIGADLVVVPAAGWRRERWFDRTGLPFVPPSPNLPSLAALLTYPGTVLCEATNLSVGRGTDAPFSQVGAPWLDAAEVVRRLARRRLAGVRFEPVRFTPRDPGDGKYPGVPVRGVRVTVTDRLRFRPVAAAVALLLDVAAVHRDSLRVDALSLDRLAGTRAPRDAIRRGDDLAIVTAAWNAAQRDFLARRASYLLYR